MNAEYWWIEADPELHEEPFGPDTAVIVSESIGGVIAYCAEEYAEKLVNELNRGAA